MMKNYLLMIACFFMVSVPVFASQGQAPLVEGSSLSVASDATAVAAPAEMTKAQKKALRKEARKAMVKKLFSRNKNSDDFDPILLIILAILIPPLAVYLYDGDTTNRFWLNLILTLIGYGLGYALIPNLIWLAGVAAIVHALLIVTGSI